MFRFTVPFILALGIALPAVAQDGQATRHASMLIHGNYCGPGNNAPAAPIDALDAACARHDACTPTGALASPACNARLEHEADLIANDPRQPDDLRTLAGFVAAGAAMLPSAPGVASAPANGPSMSAAVRHRAAERRSLPTGADEN
ncbi:hypothetical protein MKK84_21560 [Methylobacterium sp. E-065]|uniref:hypothetical protein n=1 Tax=Methylobacterium sp. E-065 TaxID=2836583 RepID=UPI001FB8B658|nr:hypothetical protein [Methylobacterium sp. E-065]MCJ2019986.1 hypothetical protein [Methylobacterium sp. E-065]